MTSTPELGSKAEKQPHGEAHPAIHQAHHHGKRLLHFIHPHTGRLNHVVPTPEELERKRLELIKEANQEDFDLLLQGSNEHLAAIRELHAHHETRRERLRSENSEVYQQFENVKNELDVLSAELHLLTDHNVALDASFDKFGYSAHLRTKDDSETSSLSSETHSTVSKHLDRSAESLKFFRRPQIRQYFHKGLLWRSSHSGEVAAFELFADLVYVGVIDFIGRQAVEEPDSLSLLHFIIVFSIAWKIWADLTMVINWFVMDDIFQRIAVCFYLCCLFAFTLNITYIFDSTYKPAIAFYITQRMFTVVWFVAVSYLVPMVQGTMVVMATIVFVSAIIWIGSIHVDWPGQLALIFIALTIDLFGNIIVVWINKSSAKGQYGVFRMLKKYFEFYPAINIEHRVERNNAFVALVFGYSVLTILFQSRAPIGVNAFFGKGILGLIQAYTFNWIYFEVDGYGLHLHAIRRHWLSSIVWTSAHLPFVMSYVLAAATLSQLILAHDCSDANPEDLGSEFVERSVAEIDDPLRWFYCGGIGIALISMGIISLCHVHKRLPKARFKKRPRLAARVCISVVIICLPLAKSLNSLHIISITTGLTAMVLIIDLFGNSCEGDKFWSGGLCKEYRKNQCTYTANCKMGKRKRRELQNALAKGEKVSLVDLLKRHGSVSSIESDVTKDEEWQGGHY